ncbi:MAG: Na+/H+ antiporter subunit E [Chromatiaceae bacterium]|jgi:multicomponent K+:H+ antiporter subunit E|nr:Na+/H+ antiporter subunit E [Chromatiaceae bacterium]
MKRLLPHPLLSAILLAIWLLLVNQLSVGHLLLGALLGWAVPLYTARFWPEQVRVRRPLLLLRFTAVVLYDILVANITVARLILARQERLQPAFVVMPLTLRSEVAISLLANTVSLTPGTVSTFLSADRRCLIIHSLHTTAPDELLATIRQRYEAPLREILEGC